MQQKSKATDPKSKKVQKKTVQKKTVQKKKKPPVKKKKSFGMIFSVILILAIVAAIAFLYFDVLGSKQMVAGFLSLDEPTQEQLDVLNAKSLELQAQEEEINIKMVSSDTLSNELAAREAALDAREGKLEKNEEALAAMQNEFDLKVSDVNATIEMFELMEAEKAAKAIGQMKDDEAIIRLLTGMSSEKAAEILNFLDYKVTSGVLDIIMEDEVPEE